MKIQSVITSLSLIVLVAASVQSKRVSSRIKSGRRSRLTRSTASDDGRQMVTSDAQVGEPRMSTTKAVFTYNCFDMSGGAIWNSPNDRFNVKFVPKVGETNCEIAFGVRKDYIKEKSLIYYTLREEVLHEFKSCEEEVLIISYESHNQTYCGNTYHIREMPSQEGIVKIAYRKQARAEGSSLLLKFEVEEVHGHEIVSSHGLMTFYDIAMNYSFSPDSQVPFLTYDPKFSDDQICPEQCGYNPKIAYHGPSFYNAPGEGLVPIDLYPFFVNVIVQHTPMHGTSFVQRCGGSIINGETVITAATCFTSDPRSSLRGYGKTIHAEVIAGDSMYDLEEGSEQKLPVMDVVLHPMFNNNVTFPNEPLPYNIAVLKLSGKIIMGNTASPVCIAPDKDHKTFGGQIVGFSNKLDGSSRLRKGSVFVREYLSKDLFSVKYFDSAVLETCGDLGSPIFIKRRNSYFQVGMVTKRLDCDEFFGAGVNSPSITYNLITKHIDFIRRNSNLKPSLCA